MRHLIITLAAVVTSCQSFVFAETLTIFNTANHAVVIGVYEHTKDGIHERLVPAKPMTEILNVPISCDGNECFAVAYGVAIEDNKITRAAPATIHGMRKLVPANDRKSTAATEEIVLQYRASDLNPERDPYGSNLYSARGDGESIKKEIMHAFGDEIVKVDYSRTQRNGSTTP